MLEVQQFTSGGVTLDYSQKGEQPRWLISTGTHGNEAGVIESVRRFLEISWEKMPDFLWVRAASPSAVRLGTRENQYNHDLNRMFFAGTTDPEALANLALLKPHTFEEFISVHEDPDLSDEVYVYDFVDERQDLQSLWARLSSQGISAYTGLDDPNDPNLSNSIRDGYYSLVDELQAGRVSGEEGTFATEYYFQRIGRVTGRQLTLEIPGRADQPVKDSIVSACFDYLLG